MIHIWIFEYHYIFLPKRQRDSFESNYMLCTKSPYLLMSAATGKRVGTEQIAHTFPKCPFQLKQLNMIMKEMPIKVFNR